ncbi:MAG: UDP-N-acetylmuramoyl-tripeptide--D-alanyl-D-alanine ligase [Alphaproteobacteria bacterium]|nr:UDP-N-acetylmuramoyl-tripeptide--D-alanyl-D-alanine ligase [Alphaproteobacteria bacterium]
MIPFAFIVLAGGFGYFAYRRLVVFLHIFQQEGYENARFCRWWWHKKAFDRRASLAIAVASVLVLALVALAPSDADWLPSVIASLLAVVLYWVGRREADPTKAAQSAKKPLVITARAKRVLILAWALVFSAGLLLIAAPLVPLVIAAQIIPLALVVANILLAPLEYFIQQGYLKKALLKLNDLNPVIIGITGSYGKTSVKHILAHLLNGQVPAAYTSGGVNTIMGITRFILNDLRPAHRYFIIEMGAYGIGSIDRLCKAFPPRWGMVSAIGPMHLERFGSIENVAQAKSELPAHALANGGEAVLAEQVAGFEPFRKLIEANPERCALAGGSEKALVRLLGAQSSREGLMIAITVNGMPYNFTAPLYGLHQADNVVLALAACLRLGFPMDALLPHLKTIPQIRHRQEVKKEDSGVTIIDDAYNSNPEGFRKALELLDVMVTPPGRRILVTPGLVELGPIHDETHRTLGAEAARHADICIAVSPGRIPTFIEGFRSAAGPDQSLKEMPDFGTTQKWLNGNMRSGDAILLANDLPDLYEAKLIL